MRTRFALLCTALTIGLAACGGGSGDSGDSGQRTGTTGAAAGQTAAGVKISQSSLGPILTDQNGRTLYAFTNDKNGASSCVAQCIATWPALVSRQPVAAATGADRALLGRSERAEGTAQATYGEWPLYYYAGDLGPGDVDGQGVDGVWFVVRADGKLVKSEK